MCSSDLTVYVVEQTVVTRFNQTLEDLVEIVEEESGESLSGKESGNDIEGEGESRSSEESGSDIGGEGESRGSEESENQTE